MNDLIIGKQFDVTSTSEKAKKYILHAKANNTIKSYKSDWKDFVAYCQARDVSYLSADVSTIANYVADMAETRKSQQLLEG